MNEIVEMVPIRIAPVEFFDKEPSIEDALRDEREGKGRIVYFPDLNEEA